MGVHNRLSTRGVQDTFASGYNISGDTKYPVTPDPEAYANSDRTEQTFHIFKITKAFERGS